MRAAVVNNKVLNVFEARMGANRLAHAFLFIAPLGTGKVATAKAVAQLVNCEGVGQQPCGVCESCVKITRGSHPDIFILPDDEDTIKIDSVRGMLARVHLRPYSAKMKVFIIPDAHRLTIEAGNALLKTLEEPADHTLIILTTHMPQILLGTISSRCQWIRFNPQGIAEVEQASMRNGTDQGQSRFIARYSQGWLALAQGMIEQGLYQRKQQIVHAFLTGGLSDDLIKEWVDDKDAGIEALEILVSLIRDARVWQSTQDRSLIWHQDALEQVRTLAQCQPKELNEMLAQVKQIKNQIDENLNAKMAWQILKERLWNPSYK